MLGQPTFADITPRRPLALGKALGLNGLASTGCAEKSDGAIARKGASTRFLGIGVVAQDEPTPVELPDVGVHPAHDW